MKEIKHELALLQLTSVMTLLSNAATPQPHLKLSPVPQIYVRNYPEFQERKCAIPTDDALDLIPKWPLCAQIPAMSTPTVILGRLEQDIDSCLAGVFERKRTCEKAALKEESRPLNRSGVSPRLEAISELSCQTVYELSTR